MLALFFSSCRRRFSLVRSSGARPLSAGCSRWCSHEPGARAELEHRHFAPRALAQPQRHHRRADARAHVDRALGRRRACAQP